jgi:hypothetical protein
MRMATSSSTRPGPVARRTSFMGPASENLHKNGSAQVRAARPFYPQEQISSACPFGKQQPDIRQARKGPDFHGRIIEGIITIRAEMPLCNSARQTIRARPTSGSEPVPSLILSRVSIAEGSLASILEKLIVGAREALHTFSRDVLRHVLLPP